MRVAKSVGSAVALACVSSLAHATAIPVGIQANLVGFYDASGAYSDAAETMPAGTGGSVAALKNQATNAPAGTDAFQAAAGNQPTIVGGLNGQNSIHFAGAAYLTSALNSSLFATSGYTLFIVGKDNSGAAHNGLTSVLRFQDTPGGYIVYPYTLNMSSGPGEFIDSSQHPVPGISTGNLYDGAYHEGAAESAAPAVTTNGFATYVDGTLASSAATSATPPPSNNLSIGAYTVGGASEFTNGDIEALLIYNTALSDTQRAQVDGFIASTYLPEPASLGLLGLGGLLMLRRRGR